MRNKEQGVFWGNSSSVSKTGDSLPSRVEDVACALPTIGLESRLIERNIQESAGVDVRGE